MLFGLDIEKGVNVGLARLLARAQGAAIAGKTLERMLQSLIVNRLNQIIENAHPQGFADGIHMVVGGDENDMVGQIYERNK